MSRYRPGAVALAVTVAALLAALLATGVTAAVVATGHRNREPAVSSSRNAAMQPEIWTVDLASTMDHNDPYHDPDRRERDVGVAALGQLLSGASKIEAAMDQFRSIGFTATRQTDPQTGRAYAGVACESEACAGWGVLLVDLSIPVRLAIEVPHPKADLNTESIGLDLFRRIPGTVLVMAGAHRRAADGRADVAHNEASMFNAFASTLAARHLTQVQLHGFADESLPDTDVIVSTGQGPTSSAADRVVKAAEAREMTVCRAWRQSCGQLEGTTNAQGKYAAGVGSTFLHLEISYSVRNSTARRAILGEVLFGAGLDAA